MVNYNQGKIYKIVCNETGNQYIGSTVEPTLARRLTGHKRNYNAYLNGKHNYVSSFEILKSNSYDIILIENFPCETKDELHARERFHIESNKCVNMVIPTRTHKEYLQDKKEIIAIQSKSYQLINKDKIAEQRKEFYQNNKEVLAKQHKNWYEANKDIILEKNKEKIVCECGLMTNKHHLARHKKSQKHLNLIENAN
jgi:hypothetical protein